MNTEVTEMTNMDWIINIENLAERVADSLGSEVAASAFARFGATGIDNLNPAYFSEVFSELMLMDEDS